MEFDECVLKGKVFGHFCHTFSGLHALCAGANTETSDL